MANVLFRVDASASIGIGHFMRCIALGQALYDGGSQVTFLTCTDNPFLHEKIKREHFDAITIDSANGLRADVSATITYARQKGIKSIVTDGYQFDTEYHQHLKNAGYHVVSIDDLARNHFVSDVVINQNMGAERIFHYSCETYTTLLLGIKYVMFRREFRKLDGWKRQPVRECENILLTLGGGDEGNRTLRILRILEQLGDRKLNIKVVLGPNFMHTLSIEDFAKKSKHALELCTNVDNMAPHIKEADLAISAPGSTVWELIKLSTPSVLITTEANQLFVFKELSRLGACLCLGRIDDASEYQIMTELKRAINDSDFRKHLMGKAIELNTSLAEGMEEIVNKVKGD
jgi:UDP-2,4-diacetamido-2,4,6-trideoxy-beta-L-altropyranose hydrolase